MYAVVDVETTGLSPSQYHRVAELAIVLVGREGRIEREWCTLVNPERDLGPQHIHGIMASEASRAPRFQDIAGATVELLQDRIVVAHNLRFDLMFLSSEYERLGVTFPVTSDLGLCTMALASSYLAGAGRSLGECCRMAGVSHAGAHSALGDARATAQLLSHYIQVAGEPAPWAESAHTAARLNWPPLRAGTFPLLARGAEAAVRVAGGLVSQIVDYLPRMPDIELADPYLAVLDQALADRWLSDDELLALGALARYMGLTEAQLEELHRSYLFAMARVALADRRLTASERRDLDAVADVLGLGANVLDEALHEAEAASGPHTGGAKTSDIGQGVTVVFTGDMIEPRDVWHERALAAGYRVRDNVTKDVSLVVAADVDSMSGKAKKARGYGIPVISLDDFCGSIGHQRLPSAGGRHMARSWAS